jgi:hypothetical protein
MEGSRKQLSGRALLRQIRRVFETIPDHRRAASTRVALADALMSGFAVFSLKFPSLLQFEQQAREEIEKSLDRNRKRSPALSEKKHNSNLRSLYAIKQIPSDTQMREILDPVDPEAIRPVFKALFEPFQRGKGLKDFEFASVPGHYLLSIDGTGYFSSSQVHCESCMKKVIKKSSPDPQTIYYHQMLAASIVHPDQATVIPVCPEPILKQDGKDKNDCERNACRRFLAKFRQDHPKLQVIVIQDALASNSPHIKDLKDYDMRFILSVQPTSHTTLFRGIEKQQALGMMHEKQVQQIIGEKIKKRVTHSYRWINATLLNHADLHLTVNFLDYREVTEWVNAKGKGQKTETHLSFVTDLRLDSNSVVEVAKGGRCRWKIENETFNTLKNQGYEFEHNFGHGDQNLTTVFAYLMMLAFLFDQLQEHCCRLFQGARERCVSRISLWQLMRSMYRYVHFQDWSSFISAIAQPRKWKMVPDTS